MLRSWNESAYYKESVVFFGVRMIVLVNFGSIGLEVWTGFAVERNNRVFESKLVGPKYRVWVTGVQCLCSDEWEVDKKNENENRKLKTLSSCFLKKECFWKLDFTFFENGKWNLLANMFSVFNFHKKNEKWKVKMKWLWKNLNFNFLLKESSGVIIRPCIHKYGLWSSSQGKRTHGRLLVKRKR